MKAFLGLVVAALTFTTIAAEARIGETETEILARYGRPLASRRTGTYALARYHLNGLEVTVEFREAKSGREMFRKLDETKFTDAERETILEANRIYGGSWRQTGARLVGYQNDYLGQWVLEDLQATHDDRTKSICVERVSFDQFAKAAQAAAQKDALGGL